MPIYDYQCAACGHHFDVLQKADEPALRKCPECGKLKLSKCLSTPTFHLSGGGWRKPTATSKKAAADRQRKPGKVLGHALDSATPHSHDDHDHGSGGSSHSHTHSHGSITHSHPPGQKHGHKH